ncbi:uncharacterized protein EAE98_001832 [Botrytis deweyae]|uniref:Uncharacterized protein n=1 Tax=Botrytis deweyae TaxID=2478750 RepID=A0ABQ7IYX7_9HELO|nr:uncharacterized protein EAE98_001832 [Botrytis deweyae]KAF7937518.1 hypothetical protein EAE98_001832 [Botrytis deweyae]
MSWSPPNDGGGWGIDDSYSSPHHQASSMNSKDNDSEDQGDFISSLHNYQFPDPTTAIKEKLATKKTELLSLREEVEAKEEKIRSCAEDFDRKKLEMNTAGAQLAEETASLITAKSAHDTLVGEILSQDHYLETIRQAKHFQQRQWTWEQCLVRENGKLKEEVESLRQLAKDHCDYYNSEVEKLKRNIDNLKLEHQSCKWSWENQNRNKDLEAKKHVAAAVKEAVDKALSRQRTEFETVMKEAVEKALSCRSTEFDTVGLEVRTTFVESHRLRNPGSFAPTQALVPYGSKSTHDFDVLADMTLYLDPQIPGHRADGETFTRIYGIKWTTAKRFENFPKFADLVNQYALAKSYSPQTFDSTTFFKVWSRMGVSFDETHFEEVTAWLRNVRKTFKTTVDLNLALTEIERTHNSDSTQAHEKLTRRHALDRMRLEAILEKKEFCATLRALPQQAGFAIRSRHLEWLKIPQGRDMTVIEKGGEVAHYADALLDAVMFVPELFDNKCEKPHDDELYQQTYHHSPIEIISMASYDHSKPLIKVINWFARIKQWRTNRDYLRTDFVTESAKFGIYPFTAHKHDWLKLIKWDSILRELESLYLKEENMNKIKYQRVDQPVFLEVDHVQISGQDWSIKDTHRAESPINNKSPTEESSKPGMSQSQYFEDRIDTPPHMNSGLPLQPVPLDWNGLPSVSSVKLASDESQNPIDDGWGPCTVTTKESSLEDMRSTSPATLPVPSQKPMHEDWNRTMRGWKGRTARGGRTTRGGRASRGGRESRGSRETSSRVSKNDPYQHNLKVLETSELQDLQADYIEPW